MKKALLILFTLCLSYSGFSQVFTLGPRVGISSSRVQMENHENISLESDGAEIGFHAGLFARLSIPALGLFVQPEALFTQSGGNIRVTNDQDANFSQLRTYKFNKLDVPVLVGLKFGILRVNAGPSFSVMLSDDVEVEGSTFSEQVEEKFNTATVGYQAGIGLDAGRLIVDLKYEGNLSEWDDEVSFFGESFSTDLRNTQIILSLGYKLIK
jgi:hypothetical protein